MSISSLRYLALACTLTTALPAAATITCCEVDGKRVCGNPPPAQCVGRERTVMQGGVKRTVEAPLTAEQRAARAAEEARKKEEEHKAREQKRRDRALLESYPNEAEIDKARDRSLGEKQKALEQAQARLDAAHGRTKKLEQEKEFYANKPLSANLQKQMRDNAAEIEHQQKAVQQAQAEIDTIKARFAADKQRYRELVGKR